MLRRAGTETLGWGALQAPLGHYRFCQALLREFDRSGRTSLLEAHFRCARYFRSAHHYQPSLASIAFLCRQLGKAHPPLIPAFTPTGAVAGDIPLSVVRELAELWDRLGDEELREAGKRALLHAAPFGPDADALYCPESLFEKPQGEGDPLSAYLAFSGWNSPFAAIRLGGVAVRSLGPQEGEPGDSARFGIGRVPGDFGPLRLGEGQKASGWVRSFAAPTLWLEVSAGISLDSVSLGVKFCGLEPNQISFLSFYISAESCAWEGKGILYPGGLEQFRGRGRKLAFNGSVLLEASGETGMRVIPLGGSNCFWNASFLVSFEFNHSMDRVSYLLKYV